MMTTTVGSWQDANQRYLMAAVVDIRATLQRHAGDHGAPDQETGRHALRDAADDMPGPAALETLCSAFGLSPFERDIVLLCAGVELDSALASACAAAHGDARPGYATFGLALAALPEPHWSALTPASPLRRWSLIHVQNEGTLTQSPLRIDERILHYLAGVSYADERLAGRLDIVAPALRLAPSHEIVARELTRFWHQQAASPPLVQLCGEAPSDLREVAAAACATRHIPLYRLRSAEVPHSPAEREALARLCEREAALAGSAFLVEFDESPSDGRGPALAFCDSLQAHVVLACREPLRGSSRSLVRLDVSSPPAVEQQLLWEGALGAGVQDGALVRRLTSQFSLSAGAIWSAAQHAREATLSLAAEDGALVEAFADSLWDACCMNARPGLDDLAQRVIPVATWGDLVVPSAQRQTLHAIASQVRRRTQVYDEWGFAGKSSRGLGVSALFAGPSGTGKTMAAEVLANELRLDLYRIDLSQVVSKYIGETEKNLRRVFDSAESGGAILLFDEADALFGKRSEAVKDSHDRYANIEVSYLLQRMEVYRGLAILTTNMKGALDQAFLRRLRFVVQFPFPDASQRAEIWRRVFPCQSPTQGIDVDPLARLNVAGGNIHNIAMGAAFLAADEGVPVGMPHLWSAARAEYAKLERPLSDAETDGWR